MKMPSCIMLHFCQLPCCYVTVLSCQIVCVLFQVQRMWWWPSPDQRRRTEGSDPSLRGGSSLLLNPTQHCWLTEREGQMEGWDRSRSTKLSACPTPPLFLTTLLFLTLIATLAAGSQQPCALLTDEVMNIESVWLPFFPPLFFFLVSIMLQAVVCCVSVLVRDWTDYELHLSGQNKSKVWMS